MKNRFINSKKHISNQRAGANWSRGVCTAFVVLICLVVAFVAGFSVRSHVNFVSSLGFNVQEFNQQASNSQSSKSAYDSISARITEVEELLSTYSTDEVNSDEATSAILQGLMDATGDEYAAYFTPERYENYIKETAERSYTGIGILFGEYDGRAYASDIFAGSQAQALGVEQGDYIVAIDGDSTHKWSMADVIGALSINSGESVVITWLRPTSQETFSGTEFTTTLDCTESSEPNVTSYVTGENVGYIKLAQISSNSADLVSSQISELSEAGAQALVVDLRGNPGGYLTQALDISSLFVSSGVLVRIQTNDNSSTRSASGSAQTNAPLVVLIDEYTSGVAEVLAASLSDNQRATLVGTTTAGKGSVQVIRELSFGGAIRYTAANYLTPQGVEIDKVGISPDVSVTNYDDETDTQLLVAVDIARSLIEE
jgi:carboxyl-terminal processing protease